MNMNEYIVYFSAVVLRRTVDFYIHFKLHKGTYTQPSMPQKKSNIA